MESPLLHGGAARPTLRVFVDDPSTYEPEPPPRCSQLSPEMTVPEFYRAWFEPIALEDASDATVGLYRDTMTWWEELTDNPPINCTNEFTIRDFKQGLREATYRRGPKGLERKLSSFTIAKHLKNARAVLRRAGPTRDPERPGKALVAEVPHIRVSKPKGAVKPTFSIDEANLIIAATRHMPTPRKLDRWEVPVPHWWRGLLLVLFYTGLRIGTALQLRYDMVRPRHPSTRLPGPWLIVPGEIVDKTSKPLDKFLHPAAAQWLAKIQTPRELIFPWPHCERYLSDRHEALQKLAGIPEADQLSPQAWRRAHGMEMGRVGAKRGIQIAQQALDHADERTTRESYVELEPELIKLLPRIDARALQLDEDRQLDLF